MNAEIQELIKAKQRSSDYNFISQIIQRGRICPAKYRHKIIMPTELYEELYENRVIDPNCYFIDESAFFEFKREETIVSFITLFHAEDMHRKIDHYLVVKFSGSYPLKRTCFSKL